MTGSTETDRVRRSWRGLGDLWTQILMHLSIDNRHLVLQRRLAPGHTGYPRGARSLWILGLDPNTLT